MFNLLTVENKIYFAFFYPKIKSNLNLEKRKLLVQIKRVNLNKLTINSDMRDA